MKDGNTADCPVDELILLDTEQNIKSSVLNKSIDNLNDGTSLLFNSEENCKNSVLHKIANEKDATKTIDKQAKRFEDQYPRKKIKLKFGDNIACFSRQDFSSDAAWKKFVRCTVVRKQMEKCVRKWVIRKEKKKEKI